jgi:hypothetical protein
VLCTLIAGSCSAAEQRKPNRHKSFQTPTQVSCPGMFVRRTSKPSACRHHIDPLLEFSCRIQHEIQQLSSCTFSIPLSAHRSSPTVCTSAPQALTPTAAAAAAAAATTHKNPRNSKHNAVLRSARSTSSRQQLNWLGCAHDC